MSWPNSIPCENHLVVGLLERLCASQVSVVDEKVPDAFSDAFYTFKRTAEHPGAASLTYTLWDGFEKVAGDGVVREAASALEAACEGVVREAPRSGGCHMAFEVDLEALTNHTDRQVISKRIASLYELVAGLPLRRVLEKAAEGQSQPSAAPRAFAVDAEQAFFVREGHGGPDSVAVMFPIRELKLRQDVVLLVLLVQEFAAAGRTSMAMAGAPNCYFSSAKNPPPELDGADPELLGDRAAVHGYITFVLSRRHLGGSGDHKRVAATAWTMLSFYAAAAYHMKSFKVAMHSRMRSRVGSMMQALKSGDRREGALAAAWQQQQQQQADSA